MHGQKTIHTIRVCFYNLMGFLSRLRVVHVNGFSHDTAGISHSLSCWLGSREIPTTEFLRKAMKIFGPKWFSEEIRKLMNGIYPIDGHEYLP